MFDAHEIIDVDSHVTEPPDLWTSRLSERRWGDRIPHVVFDEKTQRERWVIAGRKRTSVAGLAWAGWHEFPPGHPPRLADADPASWEPKARLAALDENGIYAQVLYPNLLGFMLFAFFDLKDPDLMLDCVRAYNDFLIDFAEPAPDRFVALTMLPFWDVEASVKELARCHEKGHRGVLFIGKPYKLGMPRIQDDHWAPIFEAAQERELSINFHIGFQEMTEEEFRTELGHMVDRAEYAKTSALSLIGNSETIANVLLSDFCIKYPRLRFVSVESGFGWVPYLLETLDWQWLNSGAGAAYPDRELPSYYFRRQGYSTFWFERETIGRTIDLFADNTMFETDFPHPTSLSPGPRSTSDTPRKMVEASLGGLSEDMVRKILYDNAAALYHVKGA